MKTSQTQTWTANTLADQLRQSGIKAGDRLVVHSSLKSVGQTVYGARTVVEALMEALGDGTLLVPTFTYSLPIWNHEPYDHDYSLSQTGAITEYVRQMPKAKRSFHPTHSVAVVGKDAAAIVRDHQSKTPLGIGSPLHRMMDKGAKILMLGTRQDTNSSLHLVEVLAEVPYVGIGFTAGADFELAWYRASDGTVAHHEIFQVPGCSRGFARIEPYLYQRELIKDVVIGNAASQLLDAQAMKNAVMEMLSERPGIMLCHQTNCAICPRRRRHLIRLGFEPELP